VVGRQDYLPYGEPRGAAVALPTDRAFTGQVRDATGLDYFRARYFSSSLGRFISADSIVPGARNPQNLNRYVYVYNNPLRYTDPSGHDPCGGPGVYVPDCGVDGWGMKPPRQPKAPSLPSAPAIPLLPPNGFDPKLSWSQITDVYDLLARAILTEEGNKVLTGNWEDALGAGWVMWNHASQGAATRGSAPTRDDLLAYLLTPGHRPWRIAGIGSRDLTKAAFDPGANPSYYSTNWQANPRAGHEAYAAALNMAHLIVDGDPAKDDITHGALYYGDAYADGRRRERTAFWKG
jgi:RHS repeat-associated protein